MIYHVSHHPSCHFEVDHYSYTNMYISFALTRHFDKDKTGYLDHQEFKSCLRSLGYDLSIVEEGEEDPEFEAILRTVDPNG